MTFLGRRAGDSRSSEAGPRDGGSKGGAQRGGTRTLRGFSRNASGASAIEFALLLPVLLIMLMGIVDFGMVFYAKTATQNTARDIVRQIATNRLKVDDATTTAKSQVATWLVSYTTVSVTQTAAGDPTKNEITVDVAIPASKAAVTSFFSSLFSTVTLHGKATMQQEIPL